MTWPEAEAIMRERPVVLIPLGAACKEHGPHLPLDTDFVLARELTARVAARAAVLVAPPVTYSFYPAFVEYPGSVCVAAETCQAWMQDLCHSLARHGPDRFYVLNTGISTNRFLAPTREALCAQGLRFGYTDLHEALKDVEVEQEGGTHADEVETSMMLHLSPERVRMDLAVRDYHPRTGPGPLTRDPRASTGVYSPTGIWGDPTRATAEKGRLVVDILVRHVVADLGRL